MLLRHHFLALHFVCPSRHCSVLQNPPASAPPLILHHERATAKTHSTQQPRIVPTEGSFASRPSGRRQRITTTPLHTCCLQREGRDTSPPFSRDEIRLIHRLIAASFCRPLPLPSPAPVLVLLLHAVSATSSASSSPLFGTPTRKCGSTSAASPPFPPPLRRRRRRHRLPPGGNGRREKEFPRPPPPS